MMNVPFFLFLVLAWTYAADADFSLLPIPEVLTDPNEGVTYGLMPILLLTDRDDRLEHMVASDVRYNKTTGVYPAFRLFGYPSLDQRYYVVVKKSERIDEEYDGLYQNTGLIGGRGSALAEVDDYRDSLQRFFGFGNRSAHHDETNFTIRRFAVNLRLGYWLFPGWEVAWQTRFEDSAVARGGVHSLPFTGDQFPGVLGLAGSTVHGESVRFSYDDRDSRNLTTRGTLATAWFELVDRALGSSSSYSRYGFELREFVPFAERFVLALRAELDYLSHAAGAPFYEQSTIGGEQSVRGFGDGRFRDANRFLTNAELRTEVFRRKLFGILMSLEAAPFLDAGRVFSSARDFPLEKLHVAGGMGFRAVIRPQVVGYVDLGYGSEGGAAFSGIDYPF